MVLAVVGGGASGMAAALAAAKQGCQVILLERQARVGRKLQATGNGRCNLTNLSGTQGRYHGDQPEFSGYALERFTPADTIAWFNSLGLFTVAEASGRVYPYSDQANSVLDVLRFAIEESGVQLLTDWEVSRVRKTASGFQLDSVNGETIFCDKLIIACGGLAGTKLGGTMSGYKLLRALGHSVTKLRPTLVQLRSGWPGIAALKGVRANCAAALVHDNMEVAASKGEVQFTDYGISGPVIFEISRDACVAPGQWMCRLDLLPEYSYQQLLDELARRQGTKLLTDDLLTGILHNRLGRVLTQAAGIRSRMPVSDLTEEELRAVCDNVKAFEIFVTEPLGMESAQVTAGGVHTQEFDSHTMESKLVPGLYACGEVLDVDGDCGGYNLQWAWSSGTLAGSCAGGGAE
jgi:predicted Rossmann fold flavoprotein